MHASLTTALSLSGAVATAGALVTHAAFGPESQLFGRTVISGRDATEVAFTYDDGPNPTATPQLLEVLARYNARATFFMIGKHVRVYPELVRAVHAAGHVIGNHTMTHPWLAWQPAHVIREELTGCSRLIEDVIGEPVHFLRPPHGARRPAVLRIANSMGMRTVQWNTMGFDWRPIDAEEILQNIDKGMRRTRRWHRGTNILLHDGHQSDVQANRSATIAATAALLDRFAGTSTHAVTVDAWV
jgi:peptidoglycan/xylan/chitin deacetylase (PgdA/CDA1 family)